MQKKLMQLIENSKEDSAFISSKAQMDFWLLLVGTFLVFLTVSAVAVFAIIYERNGLRQPLIGVVLSVYGAGTIMAGFSYLPGTAGYCGQRCYCSNYGIYQ